MLYWNSDIAFLPVVAESLPSTPGPRRVIVGPNNSFTTLFFDVLTRSLPGHRVIWQVATAVLILSGLLLVAWAARRVAGAWAAALTFAIGVAAAPSVLVSAIAQSVHVTTWFTAGMLLAFLIFVATRAEFSRSIVLLAVLVAVVAGTNLASDPLLLVSGIVPFVASPFVLLLRRRGRRARLVAAVAAGTGAATLLIAGITFFAIRQAGFSITQVFLGTTGKVDFASASGAKSNLKAFFSNVFSMANATNLGGPLTLGLVVRLACAAIAIVALLWIGRFGVRWVLRGDAVDAHQGDPFLLYVLFWALTVLSVGGAFAFSTVAVGTATGRYLVPIFYAIAASVPVLAAGSGALRLNVAVAVATVLFCMTSTRALHGTVTGAPAIPMAKQQNAIAAVLEREGLTRGYAGYWTANAFTWNSGGKLRIAPVWECSGASDRSLCRFPANRVEGWYTPQANVRSFLFVDQAAPPPTLLPTPPPDFGAPQAVYQFPFITILVYPYDIAERIRSP